MSIRLPVISNECIKVNHACHETKGVLLPYYFCNLYRMKNAEFPSNI